MIQEDDELTIPILEFVDAELPAYPSLPPSQPISPQICDQNTKIYTLAISMILVGIVLIIVATN